MPALLYAKYSTALQNPLVASARCVGGTAVFKPVAEEENGLVPSRSGQDDSQIRVRLNLLPSINTYDDMQISATNPKRGLSHVSRQRNKDHWGRRSELVWQ